MDKEQKEIELKKLEIERAKVLEGQIRGLILLIIALGGGLATLFVYFDRYTNKELIITMIGIGTFVLAFILWIAVDLWFKLERIKKRWK